MSEGDDGNEQPQVHRQLTPRYPVFQEAYIPTRLTGFSGPDVIEFVVNGEGGIRLLDALEGNWMGFERWDDRSFFEGDRPQIIIRLQVRLLSVFATINSIDIFYL
jgi:hypothetical protein